MTKNHILDNFLLTILQIFDLLELSVIMFIIKIKRKNYKHTVLI